MDSIFITMELEKVRKFYYALSDEVRLTIISLLSKKGELCVCELQSFFGISQPNLSFHLRVLKEANLVKTQRRGKWVYYRLNEDNELLKTNLNFISSLELEVPQETACELS